MELREQLAALCHEQWSGWMHYLFSKCNRTVEGGMTIPTWAVERWTRQMRIVFEDLSEEEKESDRKEADKFLAILESQLKQANEKIKAMEDHIMENELTPYDLNGK